MQNNKLQQSKELYVFFPFHFNIMVWIRFLGVSISNSFLRHGSKWYEENAYCVLRDLEISNTAVEEIVPMQLTASHLYTDTGRSMLACRAKTSPVIKNRFYSC